MNERTVVAYDMDGVVMDTLGGFYKIYLEFMKLRGITGNRQDFAFMNGPTMPEIIHFLKEKYDLPGTEEELLAEYLVGVDQLYEQADMIPGMDGIIGLTRRLGAKNALATSASRENINEVFKRYDIRQAFDYTVSCHEVENAKPSPDVYLAVRDKFPDADRFFVVEDSVNGMKAGLGADMDVIFFNIYGKRPRPEAYASASSVEELEQILRGALGDGNGESA